jgi:hypothetical protein
MDATIPKTATEILDEAIQPIEPLFSPELARLLLTIRLSNAAQGQIRDLLMRSNAGTLDATDRANLDNYLLVGQFLDLMQAKARVSLQKHGASP